MRTRGLRETSARSAHQLNRQTPVLPQAAALDLVRSYAHDCLHYAAFRRYRLTDRGEIARVQYGINFREPDGRTYSAPDVPGDGPTRNLGIVMEGATDAEATIIARQAAKSCGITGTGPEAGLHGLVFADVTGTVTACGMISGDITPLEAWLDARHGPGSFAGMFRAASFGRDPVLVR